MQPVAVPLLTVDERAPPEDPPLVTSARGVPRTPSRDAMLSALWLALLTLRVAVDDVVLVVEPE